MARKQRPRDFHEPWVATRSKTWDSPFRGGPPKFGDNEEEIAQNVANWEAAKARAEANADWIIWGSRLAEPTVCYGLTGSIGVADDRRILTFVKQNGYPDKAPTHEDFARRIVACVNACAGIANPESFVTEVRALLKDLLIRETDREDSRVLSLLARCIPIEELQKYEEAETFD
jgi:hypothetical protein